MEENIQNENEMFVTGIRFDIEELNSTICKYPYTFFKTDEGYCISWDIEMDEELNPINISELIKYIPKSLLLVLFDKRNETPIYEQKFMITSCKWEVLDVNAWTTEMQSVSIEMNIKGSRVNG